MQNRKKMGNTLFTSQLIQLIEKYIPKNHRYSILKSFEEKSIKEQINLLEKYIEMLKKIESEVIIEKEYNLVYGSVDIPHLDITEEKFKSVRSTSSNHRQSERVVQFSEKKILKLEELIKVEKFESDFNIIKKQYEKLFTHSVFKPTPPLYPTKLNSITTHPPQKPLGAKHEKTIEDLNASFILNKACRL